MKEIFSVDEQRFLSWPLFHFLHVVAQTRKRLTWQDVYFFEQILLSALSPSPPPWLDAGDLYREAARDALAKIATFPGEERSVERCKSFFAAGELVEEDFGLIFGALRSKLPSEEYQSFVTDCFATVAEVLAATNLAEAREEGREEQEAELSDDELEGLRLLIEVWKIDSTRLPQLIEF